jgi:hypothetical protein
MFVYVIVNSATLKIYVGQHKGNNLRQYLQQKLSEARHRRSARSILYASMRKHPRDVWSIYSLVSDLQTRAECDEWERHYIQVLKTQHSDVGYNICRGGEGFTGPHTDEWKQKARAWSTGRIKSVEERNKLRLANLGKKASPETKAKLRASHIGQRTSLGRVCSPEQKAEMSARMRNQKPYERTPEILAKQSAAHAGQNNWLGRKHSEATKAKMSVAAKQREWKKQFGLIAQR